MAKLGESQLVRLFSDIDRKPLTDNQMRTLIISLWRDYLGLYNEKFLRRPIDPEDPKQIWIKNIISEDINFGQAIGQNHLIEGNRSAAFGQGAATKSFLETVLGTYNLIPEGQNPEEWIPTDLLLTLGNGPDAEHRSNVFEILKNGFFKFLQSIKIGPHPALAEGETPEDGTLQWTPDAGLEIWDVDHWEPITHPPVTIAPESAAFAEIGDDQVLKLTIPSAKKNGFLPGSVLTWLYGLTYALSFSRYYIEDVLYSCPTTIFTLDPADLVNPRIDVPTVTILGTVEVVKGIPAENPLQPSIDVATQLALPFILLPANATEPVGITDTIIYNENVEWTPSAVGVAVDFDNLTAPFAGLKCADVGTIGNNDTILFTAAEPELVEGYETLSMFLKLKAAASTKNAIYVQFRLAGVAVTQELSIPWLITDITNWQNIALKLADFTFNATTFDSVRIRWSRVQGTIEHAGFYLDYIKLQAGIIAPTFIDTIELTGDVTGKGKTGTPFETTLKNVITAGTFGGATKTLTITVDSKGRVTAVTENDIEGGTGETAEFSTVGGWVVWRYVGDPDWIQLFQIPIDGIDGDDGRGITSIVLISTVGLVKTYRITFTDATTFDYTVTDGADGTGGGGGSISEIVEVYIDFVDDIPFTYTCPFDLRFTELEYEGNAPTLSVALNTDMTKYQDITITPDGTGLVILKGAIASYFAWDVYIEFEVAGETNYKCPYALKFTAMEHEQANAPTLSQSLNTNLAKYEALTITADAPGLVTLTGVKL